MEEQKSWFQIIRWKLIIAGIVGIGLFVVTGTLGFPLIFRIMFAAFAGEARNRSPILSVRIATSGRTAACRRPL